MSENIVKDVEGAVSAVSSVSSAASTVGSVVSGASGLVGKLAGGILTPIIPYILAAAAALAASGWGAWAWEHFVTVPRAEAAKVEAQAAVSQANAQTEIANKSVAGLQTALDDSNRKIEDMAKQCRADDSFADLAAETVHAIAPPAGHAAADINSYSALIFAKVKP
jgi:hypothetical protein